MAHNVLLKRKSSENGQTPREKEGRGEDTETSMEAIIEFVVEESERMRSPVSLLQL